MIAPEWDPRSLVVDAPASRRFVTITLLVYIALTLFVALKHEPWRDEADAWLQTRDADYGTMLGLTRYTGTPVLWYLVLAPLPKLGMPYGSQALLHLAIAAAAVFVFLKYAPLSRLTKLLVVFSYYFAYEYSVIVRNYALAILLAFIAAALFERRREHPIAFAVVVALLFNVNAHSFAIAATFAVLAGIDRRLTPILAASAFAAWWQVRTPVDHARHATIHAPVPDAFQWAVGNAFLPTIHPVVGFIAGMAVLLAITIAIRHSRQALLALWMPTAALGLLYVYIWLGGLRHAGFFLIIAIIAIWLAGARIERAAVAAVLLNATLLVSCIAGLRECAKDITGSFSGAAEMAEFIRDNNLERFEIAAHNLTQCEAVLPYLPHKRFWYAGLGEHGSYLKWNADFERALNVPYPVAEARAKQKFAGKQWLLLFNVEIPQPEAHGFQLLYTNRKPIFEKTDERYWLYAPLTAR